MHCLMKLARARHLIEVFALSSATLNRSFYQRLKSTLFEHNTIAVDGRVLKLSVSQQYQPASFGDRVRKFLLLARSVSEKTGTLATNLMELISRNLLQLDDEYHLVLMRPLKTLVDQTRHSITE